MQITTERLLLREFTLLDEQAYLSLQADKRFAEFSGPTDSPAGDARELLGLFCDWANERPRQNYQLAIAELGSAGQVVGSCGLRLRGQTAGTAEFGLELAAERWGRGYAVEAARALIAFGFHDLGLDEVRSESVSANTRVVSLARRIGLVEVGSHPGSPWMGARGWHYTEWQLTRESWERMAAV